MKKLNPYELPSLKFGLESLTVHNHPAHLLQIVPAAGEVVTHGRYRYIPDGTKGSIVSSVRVALRSDTRGRHGELLRR